jgi:putative solute:sodium symporter small subunit
MSADKPHRAHSAIQILLLLVWFLFLFGVGVVLVRLLG